MKPIEMWYNLISSETEIPEQELLKDLRRIYQENPPSVAEIIMNSYCPNRCKHCIYPPDYHMYNKNMSLDRWIDAVQIIYNDLGLKRFIFGGRTLTRECFEAIAFIKDKLKDSRVGFIFDGISAEPFLEDLLLLSPDWVDISVDGLEEDHDVQRTCKGAFRKTLDLLRKLKDSGRFEKVNILTCLTTINIGTIFEMIEKLNGEGFKNFSITPVSIMEGYRPDPRLRPTGEEFVGFIDELMDKAKELTDTWMEVGIYEAFYANSIRLLNPELFNEFEMGYEHLEVTKTYGDNEVHICYYPSSLTGTREFIINVDGDIIPPKVMAMGEIPQTLSLGNIFKAGPDVFRELTDREAFSFYGSELMEERLALN